MKSTKKVLIDLTKIVFFLILVACGGGGDTPIDESSNDNAISSMRPFITTWKTDNPGATGDNQIKIATDLESHYYYDYDIEWGDGSTDENVTGEIIHTYSEPGTYTVSIRGRFPHLFFGSVNNVALDNNKIMTVEQWGEISWQSMKESFYFCQNLVINATDTPDLSSVNSMERMFAGAESFNSQINDWDVSTVDDMSNM
ncbi:MAG: BspA family leucine-rich repeat surface protein, partial [Kangiellaceae bacterium]